MGFSFFTRKNMGGGGYETRGNQVASFLKGRVDPLDGYENDVCIYILGTHKYEGSEVEFSYYDVMDCGMARLWRIRHKTKGGIIAISKTQYDNFMETFPGRKLYLIHHHHCNFKRELRPNRPVLTVGCCGGDAAIQWPHDRVKTRLAGMGLEWIFCNELHRRERVVEFYKKIDIQIVYRPTHHRGSEMMVHGNPTKLHNAGSFGIPTVAYPEPAFIAEWGNECLYADGMGGILNLVRKLKDDTVLYSEMSDRAKVKAEEYHIDNLIPLYKSLPGN